MEKVDNHAFLHISDLHLGPKASNDTYYSIISEKNPDFYKKFISSINNELTAQKAKLQGIIITGDLADKGRTIDYIYVTEFIKNISIKLNIGLNRIFITPGNHDINWLDTESYCYNNLIDTNIHEKVKLYNDAKFQQFKKFYDDLFQIDRHPKNRFNPNNVIVDWECLDREIGLSVLILNSCQSCGLKGHSEGYLDRIKLEKELDTFPISKEDRNLKTFNFVIMHHIVSHDPSVVRKEEEIISITNREEILPILRKYNITSYFSGHIHHEEESKFYGVGHQQVIASSLGKHIINSSEFKNGYSLIVYPKLNENSDYLELRQFSYIYEPEGKDPDESIYRPKRHDNPRDPIIINRTEWDSLRF